MGFFQDLKQDLSQTVNDLETDEAVNELGLEDGMTMDELSGSSEDLFGNAEDDDFADLEAMLEQGVEALGSEPDSMEESDADEELLSSLEDFDADEELPSEEAVEPAAEEPQSEAEPEPVEAPMPETYEEPAADVEEAVEENNMSEGAEMEGMLNETEQNVDLEELLDEVEQNVGEAAYMEEAPAAQSEEETTMAVSTDTAVITAGMSITGDVTSSGNLNLIGNITGNIDILGKLNVTGGITGNSAAAEIYAEAAQINGEVKSKGSVKIGQSSVVIGNIFATSAVIAGAVKGDIDVHGPVILDTSAIVMGNIKSKSVQINNGAVIEGMCSQCYADVSPSSFFNDVKKNRK
ncbi:MAG: polymer-forming cytoskeletal protein [Roseburia sp.]|nr:polymer-forming cytoskeletal protein [Roseburia sp.]